MNLIDLIREFEENCDTEVCEEDEVEEYEEVVCNERKCKMNEKAKTLSDFVKEVCEEDEVEEYEEVVCDERKCKMNEKAKILSDFVNVYDYNGTKVTLTKYCNNLLADLRNNLDSICHGVKMKESLKNINFIMDDFIDNILDDVIDDIISNKKKYLKKVSSNNNKLENNTLHGNNEVNTNNEDLRQIAQTQAEQKLEEIVKKQSEQMKQQNELIKQLQVYCADLTDRCNGLTEKVQSLQVQDKETIGVG